MVYRIVWENRLNGGQGQGEILYASREQAETEAARADREVPEIRHVVQPEVV